MTEFIKVTQQDAAALAIMAEKIWRDHYSDIETKDTLDYLIENFQSEAAIKDQLRKGYRYFFVTVDGETAGYIAFYPKNVMKELGEGENAVIGSFNNDGVATGTESSKRIMYLSKFYLKKEFRGRGFSRDMMAFVKEATKKEDIKEIFLNVNRYNDISVTAYKHLGFEIVASNDSNAGEGHICHDYIMRMIV